MHRTPPHANRKADLLAVTQAITVTWRGLEVCEEAAWFRLHMRGVDVSSPQLLCLQSRVEHHTSNHSPEHTARLLGPACACSTDKTKSHTFTALPRPNLSTSHFNLLIDGSFSSTFMYTGILKKTPLIPLSWWSWRCVLKGIMGIWHVSVSRSSNTELQIRKLRNTTPAVPATPSERNSNTYVSLKG